MQIRYFFTAAELNQRFADDVAAQLASAVSERGAATLVVSGGRTPQGFFKALAAKPLDWSKVTITLADDRFVPLHHEASNERLVRESLLVEHAKSAQFVSLYADYPTAEQAVAELNQRVAQLPTFDVVISGMGEDGHTASLFPCSAELAQGLADDAADLLATNPTTAPHQRISFSRRRLQDSRAVFLHLVGESKLQVLKQAASGDDVSEMPIRVFIKQAQPELTVMFAAT
mgnify:CR=1 FL=1